jgi:hypothetical protein
MARHSRKLLVVALSFGTLAAIGASIAVAAMGSHVVGAVATRTTWVPGAEPGNDDTAALLPVVSTDLFVAKPGQPTAGCLSQDAVVDNLTVDTAKYGGNTYVLGDGLDQAFADAWRSQSEVAPVRVSGIVAHIFHDRGSAEWAADVIEIGQNGCAISRTLIPGDEWSALLKLAMGAQV